MPKNEGTALFITDQPKLNEKIVRNSYNLPIICETMHKLEVFQYETALDINIGYYTIYIFPGSRDLPTIVTEIDKFKQNRALM